VRSQINVRRFYDMKKRSIHFYFLFDFSIITEAKFIDAIYLLWDGFVARDGNLGS
jgi:hypothetical protein